jgi:MFS family permease
VNRPPETDVAPVSRAAWSLLALFTLLNILNFVDRTLIASLAPLLIAELGLSRADIGLLVGFGFVFFYSVAGLALGLIADRWRRTPLVAAGLALWSASTALSGTARSFAGLALPRLFVGAGEATLTPSALSMLGDSFPKRRLAFASGIYYAGVPLGTAVSLIASSSLAPRYGWRVCFFLLGGLGLLAVPLVLACREPQRKGGGGPRQTLGALAAELGRALRARRELALTLAGGALLCYGSAAAIHTVTWLVEERAFAYADAALVSGLIAVGAGLAGNLVGGAFADRCAQRWENGRLRALIGLALCFAIASPFFYLLPARTPLFYLFWFLSTAGAAAWFGPFFTALQELSPPATRASAVALGLLAINLLGVGPGPLVTGAIGDARGLTTGLVISVGVVLLAIVPLVCATWMGRTKRPAE